MKKIIPILFLCISQTLSAQNLVGNNSFEDFTTLPTAYGQYNRCAGWNNCGGTGSSDYFHTSGSVGTYFGQMTPNTGAAQMGFMTRHSSLSIASEYSCRPLNSAMIPAQSYEVSFFVTRGNGSGGYSSSTGNIGAFFSVGAATQIGAAPIAATPQVEEVAIINVTNAWQKLTFTFTPTAPFDNISIGNFNNFAATPFVGGSGRAYYFIDDVVVQAVTLLAIDNLISFKAKKYDHAKSELTWNFDKPNEVLFVDLQRSANGFEFENLAKNQPANINRWIDPLPYQGSNYYRLRFVELDGSVYYSEIRSLTFEDAGETAITRISPNPFREWLVVDLQNISDKEEEVEIRMVDMLGRKVHSEKHQLGNGRYKIELSLPSNLAVGTYMLQIVTNKGGQKWHKVVKY